MMNSIPHHHARCYVSYSGVKLPLKLVQPLEEAELENRITYFCAFYDEADRMIACEKRVYGEVEFVHQYEYYPSGSLKTATITMVGEEPQQIDYPDQAA